ncbi:hypothetical protein O1611_g2315 [Lasiodiplodia mahajangana]|uniref:Uncharacterized protein n=1 Tax=Lasiodiplodia mahajangana TaxID=1108764 RepID=A0ACC2JVE6_9PEZI|nr:hypothetical protein O1611_g2315 [Lasiodiplodia mahajangana]
MSTAELASSYAALILADDGIEITVSPPEHGYAPPRMRTSGARKTTQSAERHGSNNRFYHRPTSSRL